MAHVYFAVEIHRSFPAKLLSSWLFPAHTSALRLSFPTCRTLNFILNFMRFSSASCLLSWGPSRLQHNLLFYQQLSIDSWDTSLVTSLQIDFMSLTTTLWAQTGSQFSILLSVYSSSLKVVIGDSVKSFIDDKVDDIYCYAFGY